MVRLSLKRHKENIWQHLLDFTYNHKKLSTGLIAGMFLLAACAVTAGILLQPQANIVIIPEAIYEDDAQAKPQPKFYSPLTGRSVKNQSTTERQVTAIMIENSPVARPQSGLKNSGVVYEAIAEGGITRLLVLYQEDRPGLVGPVRSLRPYYVSWLAPYDAAIGHVGGSLNALNEIRNGKYKDIDQFFNGNYYWRATDRYAPHNVYTDFNKLDALNKSKGFTKSKFTGFPRKLENATKKSSAKSIDISVSSPAYNVHYDYNPKNNHYQRSIGGEPHMDREAGRIAPKVVIAIKVPTKIGFEDGYREQMTTKGSNKAYVFQDGKVTECFWRKTDQRSQIQFYDKNARPIKFNPGQTWITAIAPDRSVKWQ